MNDVNWWLMALAFVLGLLLTLAFMIRRVTREVPIYAALGRGPGVDLAAGAGLASGAAAAKFSGDVPDIEADEPYGSGSVRLVSASKFGPSGYVIKGNEDSMLYHSTESPSYEQTIAEVWFVDEATAEMAGFARWDVNKN